MYNHTYRISDALYGILVWRNMSDETVKPLQTLVNRAITSIMLAPFGRLDLKPVYCDLKILNIKNNG